MIAIPRQLVIGAVVTISIILLLFLTISNTSSGTLQHPNKIPNQIIVKSTTYTGQEGEEVDLRIPKALLFTLQEGDLARDIPATELRIPMPLFFHLQAGKSADAPPTF
jgi:hypothetical protein